MNIKMKKMHFKGDDNRRRGMFGAWLAAFCLLVFPQVVRGEVKLPPVLGSHMVLQRDMPVPVWGTAAPGEKVTVEFAGQKKEVSADAQGRWSVKLEPMAASGESRTMIVSGGAGKLELTDVLVGEVWVGSGQSNMLNLSRDFTAGDAVLAKNIASGPYPQIRLKGVWTGYPGRPDLSWQYWPEKYWITCPWMEATPENCTNFSALLFSFGLQLQQELKVPVGLIVGAVGGTCAAAWLSQAAYESDLPCKEAVAKFAASYNYEEAAEKYQAGAESRLKAVEKAKKNGTPLPGSPPVPLRAGESVPGVGKPGKYYEAYIRNYIPYAIRGVLWDQGEAASGIKGLDMYPIMGALIRCWRKDWGQDLPFIVIQKPSGLGCAWDEADPINLGADKLAKYPDNGNYTGHRGEYREDCIRVMTYPKTFMVTTSDLVAGTHPANKSGYGARSARVAFGAVYGKPGEIYGPIYKSHKIDGNKVVVSFDHVGKGLVFKTGAGVDKLQGFALTGEDGKFVWADAVIDGATVVVSSAKIPKPVAIRYAFALGIQWSNLFSRDGWPALTFQADVSSK